MSENLNFTDTNLSSILALISDTATETTQEDAYNNIHQTYNYTGELVNKYGLDDEPVGSEEYQQALAEVEALLKDKFEPKVKADDFTDNTEIVDTIKNTDIISNAFSSIISVVEKEEQDFKNLGTIGVGTIAVEQVKDLDGQVVVKSVDVNTDDVISERTFKVAINGQVVDGKYSFDAVPFKSDYLLKDDDFVLTGKQPKLIKIGADRVGHVTVTYDYVYADAGKPVHKVVTRKVIFVDENDNPVDLTIIPTNDNYNQTLEFDGVYNSDGSIAWTRDTKFFDAVSMQELNKYLEPFGYKKTGPDVPSTKALANSDKTEYVETVKVIPLQEPSESLTEIASESELISVETSVSESQTESESLATSESEKVEEVVSESITKRESYNNTESRTVSFKLYGTNTKLHDNVHQTRVRTFDLVDGNITNENFTMWEPSVDSIIDTLGDKYEYHNKLHTGKQKDVIFIFKDTYAKPKLSIETIFDGVTAFIDEMPVDLISLEYAQFDTIDKLMQHTYNAKAYNPVPIRTVAKRYNARLLENINKLRQSFGIRPLVALDIDTDSLDMMLGELKTQHDEKAHTSGYAHYNFDIQHEDYLTSKNVVGYGTDFSPEALADYILKNILYEANYVYGGDKSKWSHLYNLLNTDDLFIGLVYVGDYTYKEANDKDLPFSEIPKYIYNLSVSNKFILNK